MIESQVARAERLGEQAEELGKAGPYAKPLVMIRGHEPDLLVATWAKYE